MDFNDINKEIETIVKFDFKKLSRTDKDQYEVEKKIKEIFDQIHFSTKHSEEYESELNYLREKHYMFARKQIQKLSSHYMPHDTGYPWIPYFISNILEMTKEDFELSLNTKLQIVDLFRELQHPEGGFCGAPKTLPHLISTYAAVMALMNLGIKEAYDLIDIPKIRNFLIKMKNNNFITDSKPNYTDKKGIYLITREKESECSSCSMSYPGSFTSHYNGESDLRATYCAMTVASILGIDDEEITKGVVENIKKCQTFEGGFAPEPFCEAHGGYSYCAIATLVLMNKLHEIDVNNFVRWIVSRQMTVEGGFNGRTNKLVDSCYSFWQGSVFSLLYMGNQTLSYEKELLYDQLSLQAYILGRCQNQKGGLFDKPGKKPDLFHTNYATAGLICSQDCMIPDCKVCLSYDKSNEFSQFNPIFCIPEDKVIKARQYYHSFPK